MVMPAKPGIKAKFRTQGRRSRGWGCLGLGVGADLGLMLHAMCSEGTRSPSWHLVHCARTCENSDNASRLCETDFGHVFEPAAAYPRMVRRTLPLPPNPVSPSPITHLCSPLPTPANPQRSTACPIYGVFATLILRGIAAHSRCFPSFQQHFYQHIVGVCIGKMEIAIHGQSRKVRFPLQNAAFMGHCPGKPSPLMLPMAGKSA